MMVREATPDDVAAIRRVARESWEADYPDILSRETIAEGIDEWYAADALRTELGQPRQLLLVAEAEDEVVGFSHAAWTDAEGDVLRLYVAPDHRRHGFGTRLLDRTVAALREHGLDRIHAMVLADNDPGNEFYRAAGFENVDAEETTIAGESHREHVYRLRRG